MDEIISKSAEKHVLEDAGIFFSTAAHFWGAGILNVLLYIYVYTYESYEPSLMCLLSYERKRERERESSRAAYATFYVCVKQMGLHVRKP